ncbi:hypothetical protein LCGC14_1301690 [marine sediment metagenome]|uniref:Uncharacterized protein n=1 Tax=marine sediment metagenome TaxID=412755 RepID=A0A0F9NSB7_9ZZZZ
MPKDRIKFYRPLPRLPRYPIKKSGRQYDYFISTTETK